MYTKLIVATALAAVFSTTVQAEPFFAQMVLQGVTFQVESPNDSSINQVIVRANMSEGSLGQMQAEADGTITNVEIEDLNADGYPEIYVYVTSAGSGSYGSLIAYASNRNKSLSEIYLPSIEDNPEISHGYMAVKVVGDNQFANGKVEVGDGVVELDAIESSLLAFAGETDILVPSDIAQKIVEIVPAKDKEFRIAPGGHMGVIIGSKAQNAVWAESIEWLARRSAKTPAKAKRKASVKRPAKRRSRTQKA